MSLVNAGFLMIRRTLEGKAPCKQVTKLNFKLLSTNLELLLELDVYIMIDFTSFKYDASHNASNRLVPTTFCKLDSFLMRL